MPARKILLTPVTVTIGAVLLAALGGLFWLRWGGPGARAKISQENIILRLSGSNTIGEGLAPALAEGFLKQQGATEVKTLPGDRDDEVRVQGILPGDRAPKAIEIHAHGSATAFEDLANGRADIGMASRKIKAEEVAQLSSLGDMTSPACEHILGLDGIAVIVSRKNPVRGAGERSDRANLQGRDRELAASGRVGGRYPPVCSRRQVGNLRYLQDPGARQRYVGSLGDAH